MRLFKLHTEFAEKYWNAVILAHDEKEAIQKFRSVFNIDERTAIRIESLEVYGTLII